MTDNQLTTVYDIVTYIVVSDPYWFVCARGGHRFSAMLHYTPSTREVATELVALGHPWTSFFWVGI